MGGGRPKESKMTYPENEHTALLLAIWRDKAARHA